MRDRTPVNLPEPGKHRTEAAAHRANRLPTGSPGMRGSDAPALPPYEDTDRPGAVRVRDERARTLRTRGGDPGFRVPGARVGAELSLWGTAHEGSEYS